MKLKGVCVHHDAGALGAAVPKAVWARRLRAFKAMGCNAIRTAHNPPDPHLLELCDELGFLVMDEAFDEWEGAKNKWGSSRKLVGYGLLPSRLRRATSLREGGFGPFRRQKAPSQRELAAAG